MAIGYPAVSRRIEKKHLFKQIYKARKWYLFILPAVVFYAIFAYWPLYFIQIAFVNFRVTRPLGNSEFQGMKYFIEIFTTPGFWQALKNTLVINIYKLLVCFPSPIILAILMNELSNKYFKRTVQTVLYLPHFVSWIVVSSILVNFLSINGGLLNEIRAIFGMKPVMFLGKSQYFRSILVLSELWKEAGWGTIIYLAALTGIDPQLYEAAEIDGANWFQKVYHITLSGIKDIIMVMLILQIGAMMGSNFDQIQSLISPIVYDTGDTLSTFVYRVGIQNCRYSFSTAAGLFNSVVGGILLFSADRLAKRFGERGLF